MKKLIILTIILFTVQFLAPIFAQNEQKPKLVVQTGHSGAVKSAIFSPDERLIASNGQGGIIIWDSVTGREIRRIQGVFSAIDFASDSKSIVAAEFTDEFLDEEGTNKKMTFSVEIFDVSNGELLKKFPTHKEKINSVKFSHNGKFVLTASDDKTAKLWSVANGSLKLSFLGHTSGINRAVFSPDNKFVATSGSFTDSTARVWNAETGEKVKLLIHKNEKRTELQGIDAIQFSPDGKFLITSTQKSEIFSGEAFTIRIWNWSTGENLYSFTGGGEVSFSPDGKYILADIAEKIEENGLFIAADGLDGIELVELVSGKVVSRFADYASLSQIGSLSFSPNGKHMLVAAETISSGGTGSGDYGENSLRMFDVINGKEIYTLGENISQIRQLSLSIDENNILAGNYLWNLQEGKMVSLENFSLNNIDVLEFNGKLPIRIFSSDGKIMAQAIYASETEGDGEGVQLWNVETGSEITKIIKGGGNAAYIIANNQFLITDSEGYVCSDRISNAENIWCIKTDNVDYSRAAVRSLTQDNGYVAISSDEKIIFIRNRIDNLVAVNISTGQEIWNTKIEMIPFPGIFLSDNKYVIVPVQDKKQYEYNEFLSFLNIKSGREVFRVEAREYYNTNIKDTLIAYQESKKQYVFINKSTGKIIAALPKELGKEKFNPYFSRFGLSKDSKQFLATYSNEIRLYDLNSGKLLRTFQGHNGDISRAMFLQNDNFVISSSLDGTTRLWDTRTGKEFCSLISFDNETWIITTPDGRFDTNKLENPQGLHWIMPDAPFTPLSFEVFMRDYYEPNLLPRLLKCTEENNCETEFKPVRNLTELNRTQPKVRIAEIKQADSADVVRVTVEAEDAVSEYQRNKKNQFLRSGVFDLRLFRDGQLVGYAPDGEGAVGLDKNGKFTKTFTVRLPKNRDATEFNFTAYAFNADRVKSETAQKTYILPAKLAAAKGSAYIVTIGVNANENRDYDLRYAANDARRLQEELVKKLPSAKYEKIVQIPLISDYDAAGKLSENNATKPKIKAVLDRLAGKNVSADALKDVANKDLLKKVLPEDLVLIAFSGHGYADREGIFYLVPYDIGASGSFDKILQKTISSDELSLWLRDIDAGEMMMIVDACHSAAAVQGKDFKPGPMGSRGLGQLSYDKGMRILTATQANNVALELGKLQHGLLTYSLVKNGLELGLADFQPNDGKLFSNEWLSFTLRDVPQLYEKAEKGELKDLFVDGKPKSGIYILDGRKSNLNLQQPSLFDFSRRDRVYQLY